MPTWANPQGHVQNSVLKNVDTAFFPNVKALLVKGPCTKSGFNNFITSPDATMHISS